MAEEEVQAITNEETAPRRRRWRVTRRGFLIGLGTTCAGLAVGVVAGRRPFWRFLAGMLSSGEGAPSGGDSNPFAWFEITPDNEILFISSKVEMGQGVHTSLAQIGAEELAVDWEQLTVVQGGTHYGPNDGFGTGGSTSVASSYDPLRLAAASMREMLRREGALLMGVALADVEAVSGTIRVVADPSQSMTYGEIVAAVDEWQELDEEPALKPSSEHKIIGQSMARVDFESKLTGSAVYGYDMRVDGMVYGAVAHKPTVGATMVRAAAGEAMDVPGVIDVVINVDKGMAGVIAKTRQAAQAGVGKLNVEWDEGYLWSQEEIEAMLITEGREGISIQRDGRASRMLDDDASIISAEFKTPFAAHAHLEPQAALADYKDGIVKVWGSTQGANTEQSAVADLLEIDAETVQVVPTYLGGGFGRRLSIETAMEAAFLSYNTGYPVHVGWTRPDDMRQGYFRPPTRSVLRGKVENGRIAAIEHRQSSGEVAFPFFPPFLKGVFGADFGSWRGALNFYSKIENRETIAYLADLPVRTGWRRSLGLLANIFATESFMDEMAHAAGADPLQFRLDHLGDDAFGMRMKGVLTAAAEKAGYGQDLPEGHAHGIACSPDVDTVVAMVAEISVDDTGKITVHKATMAVDAGYFVNPDGAIAQTQGNIIMGLSSTLIEELTITNGVVRPRNFDTYPLITMERAPEIDVVLLESDGKPRGMGEPPLGPVAAAVGNALFNLTGKRIRQIPMTPERVNAL